MSAQFLTTNQGAPVGDNQNSLTAGRRGPTLLADYHLIEKLAHFDRERVPERVVHARGAVAFGTFKPAKGLEKYTKAAVFTEDESTPVAVRFSTVGPPKGSPETVRDPRGFAVKFYTSEGNYDLVGNNLPVFFIRDAIKFPDMVHCFKPDPVTGFSSPARIFDFMAHTPEATHMIVWTWSDMGIPASYREMIGSGVHTFVWINKDGQPIYVKYHWKPLAGERNLTPEEAAEIQAHDVMHATRDLWETIANGGAAEWDLFVQLMPIEDEDKLEFDPLDVTKTWPEDRYPLVPAGRMTLDRNPTNQHTQNELIAFAPAATVPGIALSSDKLLQGRAFSYPDTQRYRIGANYLQLPVNRPRVEVRNHQHDGPMDFSSEISSIDYEPNMAGYYLEQGVHHDYFERLSGTVTRQKIDRGDDFSQAGERWRTFSPQLRESVVRNLGDDFKQVTDERVLERMYEHLTKADPELGARVRERRESGS